MPSIRQSIRSSTASKRPTSAIADGQIALNTASGTPGMFFKDSAGNIIKAGPAHYGASAPNSSPAVGGSTGNSIGEAWLDSSLTPAGWKIWNGSAFVNATPLSSDTVQGLVELATNAETQAGVDTARAVTSASLQSKVSDSISTASASGIASSAAVKTAYDLANAALPKSGGIITGNLEIGSTGSLTFEGATADAFETTLAVVDPTADRTITFPNITGTVVTTGDTGTVTSTMILDGTIVDADINASAEIAVSKLADGAARQLLQTDAAGTGVEWASNIDIPGTLDVTSAATFDSTVAVTGALTKSGNNVVTVGDTGTVTSTMILDGTILNADVNASAAIAGTKISPDFGSQNTTTTGTSTAASFIPTSSSVPTNGVYLPAANSVAISTNGTGRLFVNASGNVGVATSAPGSPLDVFGGGIRSTDSAGNARSKFEVFTNGQSSNQITLGQGFSGPTDNVGYLYNRANAALIFGTNDAERLRITSAGLVGVGTSSPNSTLDVRGIVNLGDPSVTGSTRKHFVFTGGAITSDTTNGLTFKPGSSSTTDQFVRFETGGGTFIGAIGNVGDGLSVWTRDTSNALTVTQAGRLGIGTTGPQGILEARKTGASTTPNLVIGSGGAGDPSSVDPSIQFWASSFESVGTTKILSTGAYNARALAFHTGTDTAGSERCRLTSDGKFLVGTSTSRTTTNTPQILVESVNTTTGDRGITVVGGGASAVSPLINFAKHRSASIGGTTVVSDGDFTGAIVFNGSDGTNFIQSALIAAAVDGTPGANDMPGRLVFSTTADGASSPTERLRIDNAGNLLVGVTSGSNSRFAKDSSGGITLQVYNSSTTNTSSAMELNVNYTGNTSGWFARGGDNSTYRFYIYSNGNLTNTNNSYGAISDIKLKENIVDAGSQWSDLKALQVRKYNFKEGQTHTQIGLIAQEAKLISPGLVYESPDRDKEGNDLGTVTKSVNYSVLYMKAVKALQEAMERIESLETRLTAAGIA